MDIQTPAARSTDPHTSHAAADAITAGGKRHRQMLDTVQVVRAHPGLTSAELARMGLAERLGLDRYQIARRLPEAETAGHVTRGRSQRDIFTGRPGVTWWPA